MSTSGFRTAIQLSATDSERWCVLLIEGRADDAAKILNDLHSPTEKLFQVEWATELSSGIERLRKGGVGAVVLDLTLPDSDGIETFDKLFRAVPDVPILVLSEPDSEAIARQAVRRGARDYLLKNQVDGYRLRQALQRMLDRQTADAISLENVTANLTLDSIGEAVLRTDLTGNVMYLNRVAEKMTGWNREEALGRPVVEVLQLIDGVSRVAISDVMKIGIQEDASARVAPCCISCVLVRRDGFELGIENTVELIHNEQGDVIGAVVAFHDVSAAHSKSLEMSHLAHHDVLTGLPNRTLFNDRLRQAIVMAERQGKQLAVMFVDLDHFKKINDSLGHAVGDKLLLSVARRLVACLRRADTVSRRGGDEFVILLSQVEHAEDVAISARKILRTLASPHIIDNKSLDINASIGGSTYPNDGQDAESLMDKADAAMYEAKQHGRNNYQCYRLDMQARLTERISLEGDLRYALGRNEFLLHYQPKFNLLTGQITGVEALIRWQHPQRGLVPPADFIPIAEECGLIVPIGRWVLLEACRQAKEWRDLGLGVVPIAVNVASAEFGDKDFLSGVRAVLIATGVEPQNLELELTESVLMQDAETAVRTLGALKAMGVQLAIDDFGTGYSSFTYLRRFPVDALKLDQSFVQDITADPGDATIVSAMISLGMSLKQRVVAEGVETHAQLKFLQSHECGEGRGYYFSRPIVAEQVAKLFNTDTSEGLIH
jgi:diguanylate cyclase (GGDEF)-like protein/PAS domain S-box-containing protein